MQEYPQVDMVWFHCSGCARDTEQEITASGPRSCGFLGVLHYGGSRCLLCGGTQTCLWFADQLAQLVYGYVPASA